MAAARLRAARTPGSALRSGELSEPSATCGGLPAGYELTVPEPGKPLDQLPPPFRRKLSQADWMDVYEKARHAGGDFDVRGKRGTRSGRDP